MTAHTVEVHSLVGQTGLKQETVERISAEVAPWVANINAQAYKANGVHFTAERVLTEFFHACVRTPQLLVCTLPSVLEAVTKVARWGLDINENVYVVPMKNTQANVHEVAVWAAYQGLKVLGRRQRIIREMKEHVVYEGDYIEFTKGTKPQLEHRPANMAKRGENIIGCYALYTTPAGYGREFHWLSIQEIEERRAHSKKWSKKQGIKVAPAWYCQVATVRDFFGREPRSGSLGEILQVDDTTDTREAIAPAPAEPRASTAIAPTTVPAQPGVDELTLAVREKMLADFEKVLQLDVWSEKNILKMRGQWAGLNSAEEYAKYLLQVEAEADRRIRLRDQKLVGQ